MSIKNNLSHIFFRCKIIFIIKNFYTVDVKLTGHFFKSCNFTFFSFDYLKRICQIFYLKAVESTTRYKLNKVLAKSQPKQTIWQETFKKSTLLGTIFTKK